MTLNHKPKTLLEVNHEIDTKDQESCVNQIEDAMSEVEYVYDSPLIFDNLILDVRDAARFLKLSEKTLYNHLDDIPHKRIGRSIRFLLPDLTKWLRSQN